MNFNDYKCFLRTIYTATTRAKVQSMTSEVFDSLLSHLKQEVTSQDTKFPCVEKSFLHEVTYSQVRRSLLTQTKKRQRHQGISHVDLLALGTAWEASWCTMDRPVDALFSSSECNWTARGHILQPPDSQCLHTYQNVNSRLKNWERTLSWGFNRRELPSPVWTLLKGNQ